METFFSLDSGVPIYKRWEFKGKNLIKSELSFKHWEHTQLHCQTETPALLFSNNVWLDTLYKYNVPMMQITEVLAVA